MYNKYWESNKALLLYPGAETNSPNFSVFEGQEKQECGIGRINILDGEKLKKNIGEVILV